jgi:hypothetical protein
MKRSEWQELSSDAIHYGYNPEENTFEPLQEDGNPYPHPMQLPTRPANPNRLMAILKHSKFRPAKALFMQLTAEHLNINDLVRKLDERLNQQSTRHSGFTFYPGNPDALHPTLPRVKEFFLLNQLSSECVFLWCFASCSLTVKGFVETLAKKTEVEARIGQLLGFIAKIDTFVGGRLLKTVVIYAWLHIVFEDLWAVLGSNLDPAAQLAPSVKVVWRSRFAERELSAFEAFRIALYNIERVIYTCPITNVEEEFKYELGIIDRICDHIESAVMGALPQQLAVGRCEQPMEKRLKQMFRTMVLQTKTAGHFSTYRYFLGKQPAGTGETHIYSYTHTRMYACMYVCTRKHVIAHLVGKDMPFSTYIDIPSLA